MEAREQSNTPSNFVHRRQRQQLYLLTAIGELVLPVARTDQVPMRAVFKIQEQRRLPV